MSITVITYSKCSSVDLTQMRTTLQDLYIRPYICPSNPTLRALKPPPVLYSIAFPLGASQRHLRTFQLLLKTPPHLTPAPHETHLIRTSFQLIFSSETCPALSVALPTPSDAFPAPYGAAALLQPTPSTLRPFLILTYKATFFCATKKEFQKTIFFFFKTDR